MSKRINDEYRTAIHEAGHAVVGRHYRMQIGRATIIPVYNNALTERVSNGHVCNYSWAPEVQFTPDNYDFVRYLGAAIRSAMMSYAGPMAEEELLNNQNIDPDNEDYRNGGEVLGNVCGSNGQSRNLVDYVAGCTRDLLRSDKIRMKIILVADALVERRSLNRDEIKQIVKGHY